MPGSASAGVSRAKADEEPAATVIVKSSTAAAKTPSSADAETVNSTSRPDTAASVVLELAIESPDVVLREADRFHAESPSLLGESKIRIEVARDERAPFSCALCSRIGQDISAGR